MSILTRLLPSKIVLLMQGETMSVSRWPAGSRKPAQTREYPFSFIDAGSCFAAIRKDLRISPDDSIHLGLPLSMFTTIEFTLPKAASENLDQAVRYGLMRHVPFDLDETIYQYNAEELGANLNVNAILVQRQRVSPLLQAASGAGLDLAGIFPSLVLLAQANAKDGVYTAGGPTGDIEVLTLRGNRLLLQASSFADDQEEAREFLARTKTLIENTPRAQNVPLYTWRSGFAPEGLKDMLGIESAARSLGEMPPETARVLDHFPFEVSLVPEKVLRWRRMTFWLQAAAAVIFIVSLGALPLASVAGLKAYESKLDARIAGLQPEATRISDLRRENQDATRNFRKISEFIQSRRPSVDILRELTEIIPEDTWLNTYNYSRDRVTVAGESPSSSDVLAAIENSPLFSQARFDSPVNKRGNIDFFKITAKVE
jgi:general secretion pathway protein L